METIKEIRSLIGEVLQLGKRANTLEPETGLLGNIPEFDSMAVVSVITAIEERFDISVEDDEISGTTFETVGSLCDFVDTKLHE